MNKMPPSDHARFKKFYARHKWCIEKCSIGVGYIVCPITLEEIEKGTCCMENCRDEEWKKCD